MSRWVDVGSLSELRFQPGAPVQIEGRWIAIFPLDGGYHAIDNVCPHASAPLCDGTVLDDHVVCMLHLWQFNLRTGTCDIGSEWNVRHYDVRQVGDRLEVAFAK